MRKEPRAASELKQKKVRALNDSTCTIPIFNDKVPSSLLVSFALKVVLMTSETLPVFHLAACRQILDYETDYHGRGWKRCVNDLLQAVHILLFHHAKRFLTSENVKFIRDLVGRRATLQES